MLWKSKKSISFYKRLKYGSFEKKILIRIVFNIIICEDQGAYFIEIRETHDSPQNFYTKIMPDSHILKQSLFHSVMVFAVFN